jgi:hypothetical protein
MMAAEYRPSYLALYESGELEERVRALEKLLSSCTVCPHDCGNNRMENQLARCFSGRLPIVSAYTQHFGEEPVLVGTRGAGLIFSATATAEIIPLVTMLYKAAISSLTAFDGCGINYYEHPMLCFIWGSSRIEMITTE